MPATEPDPRDATLPMDQRLAAALGLLVRAATGHFNSTRAIALYIRAAGISMAKPDLCHMDPHRCAVAAYLELLLGHPVAVSGSFVRVLDLPAGTDPETEPYAKHLANSDMPDPVSRFVAYFDDGQCDDVFAAPPAGSAS
jgi:hypothetical protein